MGHGLLGVAQCFSLDVSLSCVSLGGASGTLFLSGGKALGSAMLRSPPERPIIPYWLRLLAPPSCLGSFRSPFVPLPPPLPPLLALGGTLGSALPGAVTVSFAFGTLVCEPALVAEGAGALVEVVAECFILLAAVFSSVVLAFAFSFLGVRVLRLVLRHPVPCPALLLAAACL